MHYLCLKPWVKKENMLNSRGYPYVFHHDPNNNRGEGEGEPEREGEDYEQDLDTLNYDVN